jgi:hypothetical protein
MMPQNTSAKNIQKQLPPNESAGIEPPRRTLPVNTKAAVIGGCLTGRITCISETIPTCKHRHPSGFIGGIGRREICRKPELSMRDASDVRRYHMGLKTYFEETEGFGVLSTADSKGRVDAAIYARPHVMEKDTVAFIMANRLSHDNLQSNPYATYLFKEEGHGYRGKRLSLTKIREEQDTELLERLRRRMYSEENEAKMKPLSLVFFKVTEERPLIGAF